MRTTGRRSEENLNVAGTCADGMYFRRRLIFKEVLMKIIRRILAVIFVVVISLAISYFLYTGGNAGA